MNDTRRTTRFNSATFTRYFYTYQKLRSVEEITHDILALDAETERLLKEVLAI